LFLMTSPENNFYRAFEDRYRGSRALIKSRLAVYLPFIKPLQEIYGECKAVDLGCGRGEYLEIMGEIGFHAHGVDLDEGMLAACHERGFSASRADAIAYMRSLPDESQVVVSGFHIAEHIPFEALQTLVQESLRVLKPGGLLILETQNPENLVVGTASFWLDPTHQRPLPPPLLSFLTAHYGFARTKILRLQESSELGKSMDVRLLNVINGVSPDYAVVAQKVALPAQLSLVDAAFEQEHGLTLEALSARFEARLDQRFSDIEAKAQQAEARLRAIYASRSWRVTKPMRLLSRVLRRMRDGARAVPRIAKYRLASLVRSVLVRAIRHVLDRPALKARALAWGRRFPRLEARLRRMVLGPAVRSMIMSRTAVPAEVSRLTIRARRIYTNLKAAIEQRKKKSI
jgi:O-antigen chain-terminating methyltransferase